MHLWAMSPRPQESGQDHRTTRCPVCLRAGRRWVSGTGPRDHGLPSWATGWASKCFRFHRSERIKGVSNTGTDIEPEPELVFYLRHLLLRTVLALCL
jgi:hypothetical protein